MGLLSIDRFNHRLLPFAKFVEILKSCKVKIGLNVFSYFPAEDMLKLCLYFNESRYKYAHK